MLRKLMRTDAGWGTTFIRVITGIIFLGHGLPKIGIGSDRTFEALAGWVGSGLGLPFPTLMAALLVGAEIVGGFALIVGLFVRPAALANAVAMFVATMLVHWDKGMFADGGYEWALLLAVICVGLVIDGAGKASLDDALSRG